MESIFLRRFSAGEVAQAADVAPATLQNWIKRGDLIASDRIEGGGERGKHRRFSWFSVMEVATAAAAMRCGASSKTAFYAGAKFGHSGMGAVASSPARQPAFPFDIRHGRTFLFVSADRAIVEPWGGLTPTWYRIRDTFGGGEGFIAIDMTEVFDRTCSRLGLHPEAVIESVTEATA